MTKQLYINVCNKSLYFLLSLFYNPIHISTRGSNSKTHKSLACAEKTYSRWSVYQELDLCQLSYPNLNLVKACEVLLDSSAYFISTAVKGIALL